MVLLGWLIAMASLGSALIVVVRRRLGGRDATTVLLGAVGIAIWNVCGGYYMVGPLAHRVSALYLVGVSLAVTAWLVLARRIAQPDWWPRPVTATILVAQPVVLALSALLSEKQWGELFWPEQPWRHEPLGIGDQIHSPYAIILIGVGAAALLRFMDRADHLDRLLSAGAVLAVSVGVGAQLTGVRIMSFTAFAALVLVLLILERRRADGLAAVAASQERDPVAGTMARAGLDRVLASAVARAARLGDPLSVLLVDVDDFKGVNDLHGHVAGDLALRHVADRLTASTDGLVGRFGGDEFVVVLPDLPAQAATDRAERLRRAMSEPVDVAGRPTAINVSIGVAQYDGGTVEDLLLAADRAMYAAKRSR